MRSNQRCAIVTCNSFTCIRQPTQQTKNLKTNLTVQCTQRHTRATDRKGAERVRTRERACVPHADAAGRVAADDLRSARYKGGAEHGRGVTWIGREQGIGGRIQIVTTARVACDRLIHCKKITSVCDAAICLNRPIQMQSGHRE